MKNKLIKSKNLLIAIGLCALISACSSTNKNKNGLADNTAASVNTEAAAVNPNTQNTINTNTLPNSNTNAIKSNSLINQAMINVPIESIGDRIYFMTDSYTLTPEAQAVLSKQAEWLNANPYKTITIGGNCDERGTREYNIALGAKRANSVKDYLLSLGISPSRLVTVSYGKERPIDTRPSEDGWAINRNAHTVANN